MYNSGEIERVFYPKSWYLSPSSNAFLNVMQKQRLDLPQYGTVPGASRSDGETFFGLHLYLARRCCENLQRAKGPAQCKSGPGNNMVSKRNHLLYHF